MGKSFGNFVSTLEIPEKETSCNKKADIMSRENGYIHDEECQVIPVREILQSCSEQVLEGMKNQDCIEICTCCGEIRPKYVDTYISRTGKCKLCNSLYEELRKNSFEALENILAISRYLKIEIN